MGPLDRSGVLSGLLQIRGWALPLVLAVLALAIGIADPRFLTLENLGTIADRCAVPLALAVGMTFVVKLGSIDLSVEGVMAASCLTFALLVANSRTGADLGFLGLLAAAGVGGLFGLLNGMVVTHLRVPSFMATLGVGSIGAGLAMLVSADQPPLIRDQVLRSWALGQTWGVPHLILAAGACLLGGFLLEKYTRFGRYGYAIGSSEEAVRLSGINADRYKLLAFILAGLLSGLAAGMESARLGLGHVGIGTGQMFSAVAAVVIGGAPLSGGRGSVLGSALGVLVLGVVASGMIFSGITPYLQSFVQGAIVLLVVAAASWHLRRRLRIVT
jgi:ribose transport system permease protein